MAGEYSDGYVFGATETVTATKLEQQFTLGSFNALTAKGDLLVRTATGVTRLAVGSDTHILTADAAQSVGVKWAAPGATTVNADAYAASGLGMNFINGTLVESRAGNAVTYAIKAQDGTNPSSSNPVLVLFRDVAAGTGGYSMISVEAATSITVSSGSTLGATSATAFRIWVVGFNDGGTFRLGVINCLTSALNIFPLAGFGIASSTAEGGAGAADAAHVFYTGTAVTSKPYAVLGYLSYETGLGTAGTWDAGPTRAQLFGHGVPLPGQVIQERVVTEGGQVQGSTAIPFDDSIPQSGEGTQVMTDSMTSSSAANLLDVEAQAFVGQDGDVIASAALFRDAVVGALAIASGRSSGGGSGVNTLHLLWKQLAASTSSIAFKVRIGAESATNIRLNGTGFLATRVYGGVCNSYIRMKEIMT